MFEWQKSAIILNLRFFATLAFIYRIQISSNRLKIDEVSRQIPGILTQYLIRAQACQSRQSNCSCHIYFFYIKLFTKTSFGCQLTFLCCNKFVILLIFNQMFFNTIFYNHSSLKAAIESFVVGLLIKTSLIDNCFDSIMIYTIEKKQQ